ncbi:membrane protein of ER body-like protein isoform X2 [Amaranthus tricolor]|uniref:membrane protein of ER body-like protein isoform X2 n=1 Tax=Amaranthus tricolor TaxID=29722 RepID=UPI00258B800F|nr:membrane protein of ER body-like protein isoform X2 [Amaranthus tricolor]
MEVPYEREEEEAIGVEDLQPRRRSSHPPNPPNNNNTSSSSESSFTSDSSFHGSVIMDNDPTINGNSANIFTNGENPTTIELDLSHGREKEAYFEEPISVAQNGDSNGFTIKQNGVGVVEYSLPERNGGDEETDNKSIASDFFKNPETAVGLQYVESLLDDSSNGVNGVLPKIYNGENIADNTLIVSGQTEIVETGNFEEVEPEGEEFDVERVIKEQKTHDLYCPNCNKCITDRVVLKRRKRKRQDLPKDEPLVVKTGRLTAVRPDLVDGKLDNDQVEKPERSPDERLEAISCFSCFHIFLPKGDGFLCWRFKPKQDVTLHPDEQVDEYMDPTKTDTGKGTAFPLWILTCCQPYHPEDPVPKPGQSPPNSDEEVPRKENDIPSTTSTATDVPPGDSKFHSTPSHDTPLPSKFQPPIAPDSDLPPSFGPVEEIANPPAPLPPVSPEEAEKNNLPMWIFTCCQPASNNIKHAPRTGTKLPIEEIKSSLAPSKDLPVPPQTPVYKSETELPPEQQPPAAPKKDISPPETQPVKTPGYENQVPTDKIPDLTSVEGTSFPLWFVNCCQLSKDKAKAKPSTKPDEPVLSLESKPSQTMEDGTEVQKDDTNLLLTPSDADTILPVIPPPSTIVESEQPVPPKSIYPKIPDEDVPPPPDQPEAPSTPPKGDVIIQVPDVHEPQPLVTQPGASTSEPQPLTDNKTPLIRQPSEPPRPGAGVDIMKAIVYGGLLECITSLSVISSAAGGDATTLNIVALGLANVFGGFIVLFHNLKELKHEQGTERYSEQLGRAGHFVLHAFVSVLSYLVFGLMSPIIYGFTFRKSDNKDYKLATLAAASLVCITILSIGKAYVQKSPKPYFSTVFIYVSMGFMVSGITYVAGDLINMLLKKLGVFDYRAPRVLGAGAVNGAWSAY